MAEGAKDSCVISPRAVMTIDLDELAEELSEFEDKKKAKSSSPLQDRVIAGFEEINRFVDEHERIPQNIEGRDIFERLYAVRLKEIRKLEVSSELLSEIDSHGLLLIEDDSDQMLDEDLDEDDLLAELETDFGETELSQLTHVRSSAEKRAAEEIANRTICQDFDQFAPLFKSVQADIKSGMRPVVPFGKDAKVEQGDFFIVDGLTAYVAHAGEEFKKEGLDRTDARLRVIFSNKTESDLLRTSLQRALYKDDASRRVARDLEGSLFGNMLDQGDVETGVIYVLRSLSEEPFIAENRELIHKIGVTGGSLEKRIANAQYEATYLLAGVEVVREFKLVGINRKKLEKLLDDFFSAARLDIEIPDRFGKLVRPREWFLVPLAVIDETIQRIREGTITDFVYDREAATLVPYKLG